MLTPPRGCDRPPTRPSIGYVSSPIRARYEPYSIWVVVPRWGVIISWKIWLSTSSDRLAVRHKVASKNIAASGHPHPTPRPAGKPGLGALLRCLTADSAAGVRRSDRRPLLDRRSDGRSGRTAAAVRGRPAAQARSIRHSKRPRPRPQSPGRSRTPPLPRRAATQPDRPTGWSTSGVDHERPTERLC